MTPPDDLHPDIAAALERDGVPLARVAELTGLDVRTLERLRLDGPTEERARKYRDVDAWIEGRARAVERPGESPRWRLEPVPPGSTPDVERARDLLVRLAHEAEELAADLRDSARNIAGSTKVQPASVVNDSKDQVSVLTPGQASVLLGGMNAQVLHSVAHQVRARSKGRMVGYNQKVPPDFEARLEQAAAELDMSAADFLRALVEINTRPVVQK